jgi:hypothetical protein
LSGKFSGFATEKAVSHFGKNLKLPVKMVRCSPLKHEGEDKMQIFFAIEANSIIKELPEFEQLLQSEAPPQLVHGNLYIYDQQQIAEAASALLAKADLLEDAHQLIKVEGSAGADFYDYGFHISTDTYLYTNALSAFTITDGSEAQIEMALIQLEEHLVYTSSKDIYFTINHYTDLVLGIVKAYEVKVEFLDLDK